MSRVNRRTEWDTSRGVAEGMSGTEVADAVAIGAGQNGWVAADLLAAARPAPAGRQRRARRHGPEHGPRAIAATGRLGVL